MKVLDYTKVVGLLHARSACESAKVEVLWLCSCGLSDFGGRLLSRIAGGPWVGCKSLGVLQRGVLFGAFFLAKPQARGVQKSGTLRFLADDFSPKVGVKIGLSKNLEQATIMGDCGVGSEAFFWPGGGGDTSKKVPDTFYSSPFTLQKTHFATPRKKGIQNVF